ncbi:hypothetical protein [Paracoccus sp. SCSIO 75233]|uniref:hypothetical protein n=1 Tax=Paracoccus sp. SCSIO 75233 TaxID=3017782 RepID=UPI0022F09465|nr:hypothetical protein [Paracoccus sp. SCSIO 75233]WBU52523.1 hypothetical protein PAF12_11930 [Paracoccus sp. SCSIO 75233]
MRSTALKQFQRLEAQGNWRSAPGEAPREVIVSIGEATLILSDPKSDKPLTHWSLPAVERTNPGKMPAIYIPAAVKGDQSHETLEIDDTLMIEAIDKVQTAIAARHSHPGRLRGSLTIAAFIAMLIAGIIWLPGALRDYAVRITPAAERSAIGTALLNRITAITGAPCRDPAAEATLIRLSRRIGLPGDTRIVVLPEHVPGAIMLPGQMLIADAALIQQQKEPEALAGHLLVAQLEAELNDPLRVVLEGAGLRQVMSLLTSGKLSDNALAGLEDALLRDADPHPSDAELIAAFTDAQIPSTAYATTLDDGGHTAATLTEADPFRTRPSPPVLSERDWNTLQQICVGRG